MEYYFISLIPKNHNPHRLSDYHPICLIGNIYRIISKLLVDILKGGHGQASFEEPVSFIPNRGLFDGVLVLNVLVDFAKINRKCLFLFKVYFKKHLTQFLRSVSYMFLEG